MYTYLNYDSFYDHSTFLRNDKIDTCSMIYVEILPGHVVEKNLKT